MIVSTTEQSAVRLACDMALNALREAVPEYKRNHEYYKVTQALTDVDIMAEGAAVMDNEPVVVRSPVIPQWAVLRQTPTGFRIYSSHEEMSRILARAEQRFGPEDWTMYRLENLA